MSCGARCAESVAHERRAAQKENHFRILRPLLRSAMASEAQAPRGLEFIQNYVEKYQPKPKGRRK
jgi:hypothetical protein